MFIPTVTAGSLCGCLTYEHPYERKRRSGLLDFFFSCICPAALATNEHALHALSQAHGRAGVLSGQLACCSDDADDAEGGSKSGRAAGRRMQITGWFSLLLPLLWPLLALLSLFQRLHVVRAFRIEESKISSFCKGILCMPCSLWQVRTFLQERQCEECDTCPTCPRYVFCAAPITN